MIEAPAWAGPGDHIRPSDTVTITPNLDLAMEYRTNVYRDEANATPGANLRISPGLAITAEGPDHEFQLGGSWDIREFVYVGEVSAEEAEGLSRDVRRNNLDRYNDFNIAAGTELFKQDVIGLQISDKVSLRNNSTDAEYADSPFTTQFRNALTGGIRISPSSAFSIIPGASWSYDDYRVAALGSERYNARTTYGPQLQARWDFFPRTSLVVSGSYLLYRWGENVVSVSGGAPGIALPNSQHIRARAGLEGQLTSRLLMNLSLGYGTALYSDDLAGAAGDLAGEVAQLGDDLTGIDGLLATIQMRYVLQEDSELFLGYKRDFTDSFFTNYILYNYVYGGAGLQVGDLRPSLRYGIRLEEYAGTEVRNDIFHRFNGSLGYDVQDWATLSAGAALQARASEDADVEYQDWNIHVVANFTY